MKNGDKACVCTSRISVCNLGMALGIVWGLTMFLSAILTMLFGIGTPIIDIFGSIYWGLEATVIGSILGLFWGFIGGYITGALIAFFYNFCSCNCPCKSCSTNRKCCK